MLFADFPPAFAAFSHATIGTEIKVAARAFPNLVAVIAGVYLVAPVTRPNRSIFIMAVLGAT